LEREAGIEPATFSLVGRRSIENSEHNASRHLILAIESTGISRSRFLTLFLQAIKQELFAIEQDKLTGAISASEYAELKTGLGVLLKRHLAPLHN
jgi:hypothetical protein